MFLWLTLEFSSAAGRISCELPWQEVQVGVRPFNFLMDAALACRLPSKAFCASAWQSAQETLAGVLSCGEVLTCLWQSTHWNIWPWMEAPNFFSSTARLSGLPPTSLVKPASGL